VQNFLDGYLKRFGGRVDYVHGDLVAKNLGRQAGNLAVILPAMEKTDLFKTVVKDGALPRKPFPWAMPKTSAFISNAGRSNENGAQGAVFCLTGRPQKSFALTNGVYFAIISLSI
jgi:hypothetical protein